MAFPPGSPSGRREHRPQRGAATASPAVTTARPALRTVTPSDRY